jgi:hypothetical protein
MMPRTQSGNNKRDDISRNELPIMHPSWRWTEEELGSSNMTSDQKQAIIDRIWEKLDD